jgi:hypothetical protein
MLKPALLLAILTLAGCAGAGRSGTASPPIPNAGVDAPIDSGSPDSGTIAVPGPGPSGVQGGQPTTGVEMQAPPDTD